MAVVCLMVCGETRRPRSDGHEVAAEVSAAARRLSSPDRDISSPWRFGNRGALVASLASRIQARTSLQVLGQSGTARSLRPLPWMCTEGLACKPRSPTRVRVTSETRAPVL